MTENTVTLAGLIDLEPQLERYQAEAVEAAKAKWGDWIAWLRTYGTFDQLFRDGQPAAGCKAVVLAELQRIHQRHTRYRAR